MLSYLNSPTARLCLIKYSFVIGLLCIGSMAFAQPTQRLNLPDAAGGSPVAIWKDLAIVGISGGACIFEQDSTGWVKVATLQPEGVGNQFGLSVDIQRNRAILGDMSSRKAYIFRYLPKRNAWVQEAVLSSPSNQDDLGGYGISVSIQGGWAMVGDHWDNELGESSGAVYVYQRSFGGWKLNQKLVPTVPPYYNNPDGNTPPPFDYYLYGWDTDIDLGRAVVTSYWQAAAYVYRRSFGSWHEQQVLEQLYPLLPSVDISGKYIAANTSEDVFIFNYRQGSWQGTRVSQPYGDGYEINPVAITPTTLAFQRVFEDYNEPEPRREIFVYGRQGADWQLRTTLEQPEVPGFGDFLDLSDTQLIIGTEGGYAEMYPVSSSPTARTTTPAPAKETADVIVAALSPEQTVRVYPVPMERQLHVDLIVPSDFPVAVVLYDMFGRRLAATSQTLPSESATLTLDLSTTSVPSGVVFLEITTAETGRQILKLMK